jgi:hypothetical protein
MANRIRDFVIVNHRLDPIETELHIHVKVDELSPATGLRGRLTGPRCAYASTVEIAYPMKQIEHGGHVVLRVVIPEPSWWHPQTPFLYQGPLELWENGAVCERVDISHGIRLAQLTPKGLRLNGKPYHLRARLIERSLSESEAAKLRAEGVNTLLTTTSPHDMSLWHAADRLGFFMLGSTDELGPFLQWKNDLTTHVSSFGWIFQREQLSAEPPRDAVSPLFYGVNTSAKSVPPNADFLVCHESELAWLDEVELPKLVVTKSASAPRPCRDEVIGWIELPTA